MSDTRKTGIGLTVGQKVWVFDENTRVRDSEGRVTFRGHFKPMVVSFETPKKWYIGYTVCEPSEQAKRRAWASVPKNATKADFIRCKVWTSEAEIDEAAFVEDNRHTIAERVRDTRDAKKLKRIEAILNEL